MVARGLTPVVVGTRMEAPLVAVIREICPQAVDLVGQTAIAEIFGLARGAALAVGNDTGPMHLAAASAALVWCCSPRASDPALTAPRGPGGTWPVLLREPDLSGLAVERVAAALP